MARAATQLPGARRFSPRQGSGSTVLSVGESRNRSVRALSSANARSARIARTHAQQEASMQCLAAAALAPPLQRAAPRRAAVAARATVSTAGRCADAATDGARADEPTDIVCGVQARPSAAGCLHTCIRCFCGQRRTRLLRAASRRSLRQLGTRAAQLRCHCAGCALVARPGARVATHAPSACRSLTRVPPPHARSAASCPLPAR
jgi:hypothetical protein